MYLIDTVVISEIRKQRKANPGVASFFQQASKNETPLYLSAVTIGELWRGAEMLRHRGDVDQAGRLEHWFSGILDNYSEFILPFGSEAAQVWGHLRVPHPEHPLDKQIAAIALVHDLTLVTRNIRDFAATGVRLLNPFSETA